MALKTDTIFYRLCQTAPGLLLELAGLDASQTSAYAFQSVEVKQTAFRMDGLLLPTAPRSKRPVCFGEFQFQRDDDLHHRFFAEIFVYLDQFPKTYDWQGVLVYPRRSLAPKPGRLYRSLLASEQVSEVFLDEMESSSIGIALSQLVIAPRRKALDQAHLILDRSSESREFSPKQLIDLVETIMVYKFANLSREEIAAMLGFEAHMKQTRYYRDAFAEGQEDGIEKGIEKGVEQGVERGRQASIAALLKVRFKRMDAKLKKVVLYLSTLPEEEAMRKAIEFSKEELIDLLTD